MGNVLSFVKDRLTNVLSGMGTSNDKRAWGRHLLVPVDQREAEAAYRSSWLVRKIVDIPPFDMTREWRSWQTDSTNIEALEAEERRLGIKQKSQRALILSRLYGGGALILGTGDGDTTQELKPERINRGGLKYVHVMSRHQLSEGSPRLDPEDPWFGQPDFFSFTTDRGVQIKLHPSRVIAFVGQKVPEGALQQAGTWFWGDPIMQSVGEAVNNADLAQAGFASLIDEAKVDIIKMKDLTTVVATEEGEQTLMNKLSAMKAGKSVWRMLALDIEDEWEQRQVTWAGIPDTMMAFLQVVAGAADIPVTRLLGQSPKGLQSTGDGEERDYHSMVAARQAELLSPCLDRLDEVLVRSALGNVPSDIYYEWPPLHQLSEKESAEVASKDADTIKKYADTGLLPDAALAKIASNRMVESGHWPGSEKAFEEHRDELENPDTGSEEELQTLRQQVQGMQAKGTVTAEQADMLITDARPRSLYVRRDVVNAAEIRSWAEKQGIPDVVRDLHVSIVYSREPIDWMKAGNASEWSSEKDGKLTIAPGGPRAVEPLGDMGAVLMFASSELSWRHRLIVEAGASHDYDDYLPHISLTKAKIDADAVEPYCGKIILGPEIFEELDDGGPLATMG